MDLKQDLINRYVKSVQEKEQLLQKLNLNSLSEEELHRYLLLTCSMNELVGQTVETGLIQIEVEN